MDKDPNQSLLELIIPKGILDTILFSLKYPSLPSLFKVSRFKTVY